MKLQPEDEERNSKRPMLKLQYVGTEKSSSSVEVIEIADEKVNHTNKESLIRNVNLLILLLED